MEPSGTIFSIFDELEKRVEQMRQDCLILRDERDFLINTLGSIENSIEFKQLHGYEREEISIVRDRLLKRATTVEVTLSTPRSDEQIRALEEVNAVVDKLLIQFHEPEAQLRCEQFYNSCVSDATGPVNDNFQKMILDCTVDDQRHIRKKLHNLMVKLGKEQRR